MSIIVMVAVAAIWMGQIWERAQIDRKNAEEEVRTVENLAHHAFHNWLDDHVRTVEGAGLLPGVSRGVLHLVDGGDGNRSAAAFCRDLVELVGPPLLLGGFVDLAFVDAGGTVLCADLPSRVGARFEGLDIGEEAASPRGAGFALLQFEGQTVETVWAVVTQGNESVVALVAVASPSAGLTGLFSEARFGDSAETFAVSADGRLISDTRFDVEEPGSPPLLHGFDSVPQSGAATPARTIVLTPSGTHIYGENFDGYTDYRGEQVVGAWYWDASAGLGVVTEFDKAEAYGPVRHTWLFGTAALIIVEALIGSLAFGMRLTRRGYLREKRLATRLITVLNATPVALWELDLSAFARWAAALPAGGTDGLRAFLAANPEQLEHGLSLVRIRHTNRAAHDLINGARAPLLFNHHSNIPLGEEPRRVLPDLMAAIKQREISGMLEITGIVDGSVAELVVHWEAATDPAGLPDYSEVVVVVVDLTDRAETEERLIEIIRSKDQLVSAISHEMRTPLTSVLGFAKVLTGDPGLTEPERVEMLDAIAGQARDLTAIVDNLVTATRIRTGSLVVESRKFTLDAQARQVLQSMSLEDEVTVSMAMTRVVGDPVRVREIINILVRNAVEHGGGRIHISGWTDSTTGYLQVRDGGAEIPADLASRMFNAFERGHGDPGLPGSVGMGLYISRYLAKQMGGDLSHRRTNGETVFELSLPLWSDRVGSGGVSLSHQHRLHDDALAPVER